MVNFAILSCHILGFLSLFESTRETLRDNKHFDIKSLLRKKRYLVYPNPLGSETKLQVLFGLGLPMEGDIALILGYVLKCNYNFPYNGSIFTEPYIRYQRDVFKDEKPVSRWSLYRLLATAMETFGSGRVCLLRAICEAAESPFRRSHGLLGELLHVLLTPSSTSEELEVHEDHEYHRAELMGRGYRGACSRAFSECVKSPLDYFTSL
ncbi:uncharacterized protein LOC107036717 [Diachasma alloeum]|uniref:uncharacterized protein LOC107036717 n=1 Tax=Diachasma alloeum TaxID=454923 RepID=UPI0007381A7D|nr:uncharacterized protein LOC107036717 [Diachasma alloeum]